MEFLLGVNYWASNAGLFTWRNFDATVVEKDFKLLSENGVNTIRVFPSWDVFQPITDTYGCKETFRFRVGETPVEYTDFPNSGLSKPALENFKTLLNLAEKYNLKVIVALITGWMSGRRFMPDAIKHLNPITDPKAVNFECRFIKDFIAETKNYKQIIAWEPGNECNAMSLESEESVNELWLSAITNTIRSADPTRPIFAGMHGLSAGGNWKLETLGLYTDVQTVHPYPQFTPYCSKDALNDMRSVFHAAAENEYYASISKTPCMVEEIGSLGPMFLSNIVSYVEKALVTSFASGSTGFLWWCAFDQDKFDFSPYDIVAMEQNLGLANVDHTPKPELLKLKETAEFLKNLGKLPKPNVDATVILNSGQDEWAIAYGSYMLAIQSGLNVDFMYENQRLPKRDNYIIPCISDLNGIPKLLLDELVLEVKNGANLYITYDGGYVGRFEEITGLKVAGRYEKQKTISYNGGSILADVTLNLDCATAKPLILTDDGNVLLSENALGKGKVFFLNAPLERAYTIQNNPEETNLYKLYKDVIPVRYALDFNDKKLAVYHYGNNKAMLINFNDYAEFNIPSVKIKKVINGEVNGSVLTLTKPYAYIEYEEIL